MSQRTVLFAALGVLAAVAAGWAILSSEGEGSSPPPQVQVALATASVAGTPWPSNIPTLTDEQRQRVIDIIMRDATVRRLFDPSKASVGNLGAWHKSGPGLELIGGAIELTLPAPATLRGEFLNAEWDETRYVEGYRIIPYTAAYANVTLVSVRVDLRSNQVADITPLRGATIVATPVFPPGYIPPTRVTGR